MIVFDPSAMVWMLMKSRHAPVHKIAQSSGGVHRMMCGWQRTDGVLTVASEARYALDAYFCIGCWRAER